MTPEEIRKQIEANLVRARDIAAFAETENRDLTAEERTNVKAAIDGVAGFRAQLEQIHGDAEMRRQIMDLSDEYKPEATAPVTASGARSNGSRGRSPGQQFYEHPDFQSFMNGIKTSDGAITKAAFGHSPRVVLNDLISLGGSLSGGEMTSPEQTGILVPPQRRPLTIRDAITTATTSTDSVEYVEVTSETNAAATVPEATSTSGAVGTKPESAATFTRKSATVRTIAHWIAITRQALSDAGQMRAYIDGFLRDGLLQELEDQIVAGGGTGEDFAGLMTAYGLTQAFATDLFTTTRKARTNLRLNGRAIPNAWLLHPNDAEDLDLLQDNEARYYHGGPFGAADNMMLWRVPVIEHEAVTEGYALLGNFKQSILWVRSQPEVLTTDSHADLFVKNIIVLLAEMRAAFALIEPKAIIRVDLTA